MSLEKFTSLPFPEAQKRILLEQKEKIILTLKSIGFSHGHPHSANFCLRFYRNSDNSINFDECPRIYLIDFDRAMKLNQDQIKLLEERGFGS